MRKVYIFIMIILVILILAYIDFSITGYVIKREYSFKDGLKEVRGIEKQFTFDQGYPQLLDDKWSMLGYLSNVRNYVDNLKQTNEIRALHYYMWFRTKELKSKIKFQLATKYKLRVMDDGTLICPKKIMFDKRMQYFNESVKLGSEAITNLNILIKYYPKYFEMTKIERITPKLLEAQYYQIEEDRKQEEDTIMGLCFR